MPSSDIRLGQKSNLGKFIYEQHFSLRCHKKKNIAGCTKYRLNNWIRMESLLNRID